MYTQDAFILISFTLVNGPIRLSSHIHKKKCLSLKLIHIQYHFQGKIKWNMQRELVERQVSNLKWFSLWTSDDCGKASSQMLTRKYPSATSRHLLGHSHQVSKGLHDFKQYSVLWETISAVTERASVSFASGAH